MLHPKVLLLLLFCTVGHAGAQTINFPDANFKARLLEADVTNNIAKDADNNSIKIDANADGEIQQDEALLVYRLFYTPPPPFRPADNNNPAQRITNDFPIADITGLEYFTNLRKLGLSDNIITQLELPLLPMLDYLNCSHNPMTSITLPELPGLTYLDCSQNELTALTLQNLPALEVLLCDQNQITALVPAGLSALRVVNCNINLLETLIFGNNPVLKTVSCALNQLTQLDLNGTAVETLYCSDNLLLNTIKIKNNVNSPLTFDQPPFPFPVNSFDFSNLPALGSVCCDPGELAVMQEVLSTQPAVTIITDCIPPAIISFTDPDFKQYLLTQPCAHFEGNFYADADADLNNDGEIDVDEALVIQTLSIGAANIENLGGLEYFENLWSFGIGGNPLSSFEDYGLERLTHLNFNDNQLSNVSLSGLVALENLQMVREPITQVDFNGLENLSFARFWQIPVETLNFCGTGLVYFDGHDLPNLTYFSSRNGIVTTDGIWPQTPPPLSPITLNDCPALQTVCHDADEMAYINWGVPMQNATYVTDCPEDCSILGIRTPTNLKIGLYLNPASDVVHITIPNAGAFLSAEVCNMLGQSVLRSTSDTADISGLQAGSYWIKVKTMQIQGTQLFIKQ